ncbi:MAG TPA: Txe/YoeB family addiction module toxin [Alphaproteobacteria bacterium]|nr:Txe/YoeB family addiction module toxin [Alphaproteobacteria bacterium]
MKFPFKLLNLILMTSSALSLTFLPAMAMEEKKIETSSSHSPRAKKVEPSEQLPLPQSFHRAAEFEGIRITPNHVLDRRLLLGNSLGNHTQEERGALTKNGVTSLLSERFDEAKSYFERAALYGDSAAMFQLGKLYGDNKNPIRPQDASQALQWHILAFQTKWQETGEHYAPAVNSIKGLQTEPAKAFIKTIPHFYPLKKNTEETFLNLYKAYVQGTHECHLSTNERELRRAIYLRNDPYVIGNMYQFDDIGLSFNRKERIEKATLQFWLSQDSNSLYSIGVMLRDEDILPENLQELGIPNVCRSKELPTNFAWAGRLFAEVGDGKSFVNLGNMLQDGRVTKLALEKAGALKVSKIKKAAHLTDYQLAAWLYKNSRLPQGLEALEGMLSTRKISFEDLHKLDIIKFLGIKSGPRVNVNTVIAHLNVKSKLPLGLSKLAYMLRNGETTPQQLQEIGANSLLGIKDVSSFSPHELAIILCVKSGTLEALSGLAFMLKHEQITPHDLQKWGGNKLLGIKDVSSLSPIELTVMLYVQSQSLYNLGVTLVNQKTTSHELQKIGGNKLIGIEDVTSLTNRELAACFFAKEESEDSCCALGSMLDERMITPMQLQTMGIAQRFDVPQEALRSFSDSAAFFFEKAAKKGNGRALFNLGSYYYNNILGKLLTAEERYKIAEEYFITSNSEDAKNALAYMYLRNLAGKSYDPLTRYQKAVDLLEFARLEGIEDEELLNHAKMLVKLYLQQEKYAQLRRNPKPDTKIEDLGPTHLLENISSFPPTPGFDTTVSEGTLRNSPQQALSLLPKEEVNAPMPKQEKGKERKAHEVKKKIKHLKSEIKKRPQYLKASGFSTPAREKQQDFNIEFLTPKAKKDFESMINCDNSYSSKKIQDIIQDIFNKPLESKGMGRPKPLKGDLKGWWSRRITGKDRLVYRIESGKIIIHSYEGHYKKRK